MKTTRELWYHRLEQSGNLSGYIWDRVKVQDLNTSYLPITRYNTGYPLNSDNYYEIVRGYCYT